MLEDQLRYSICDQDYGSFSSRLTTYIHKYRFDSLIPYDLVLYPISKEHEQSDNMPQSSLPKVIWKIFILNFLTIAVLNEDFIITNSGVIFSHLYRE